MIKRYKFTRWTDVDTGEPASVSMEHREDGEWVKSEDYSVEVARLLDERDRLREWAAAQRCENVRLYGGLPIPPEYAKVTCGNCVPCQARAKLRDGGDDDGHGP
jgi:hypothetical protein